ncbi:MAG: sugar transferase [Ruminococcus sp.]|nr:sugar transferase [Ruminococcus sp.]
MYERFIKRPLDCFLATGALIVFSPIMLALTIVGAIKMGGNPFFAQDRPGKNEKIFKLIKFRSMNNKKDEDGNLLPDSVRLTKYGKILRATSMDEIPELISIIKGDMAIIGPRPLLVQYLPYYRENERRRHSVRPGLTGYAQVHGRNYVMWDERMALDCKYVDKITFTGDVEIIYQTLCKVLKREDVAEVRIVPLDEARKSEVVI